MRNAYSKSRRAMTDALDIAAALLLPRPRFSPRARPAPGRKPNTPISKKARSRISPCAATACSRWRRARAKSDRYLVRLPLGAGAGFQGNLYAGGGPGAKLFRILARWQGAEASRWPSSTPSAFRPSPSIRATASMPPPRPTARSTASPAMPNPKSSTIPKRSTSGRWRSIPRAISSSPPAIRARSIA